MSFKLGQLIEHKKVNNLVKIKKKVILFLFELLPFVNLDRENLISQKLLQVGASNLDSW